MDAKKSASEFRWVPAEAINDAVQHDLQFRMPLRPQLCRGLHIVEIPDGILVDGAAERQYLRGASAKSLRTQLFPLLDGTRDIETIAVQTEWSPATVQKAMATLYFAGLLEDASSQVGLPPGKGPSESAALWMSRTLDCSRNFPHSSHMMLAASQAVVRLAVRTEWYTALLEALGDIGIHDVDVFNDQSSGSATLVVLDLAAPAEIVNEAARASDERGMAVLLADECENQIKIGPCVDSSATACIRCALRSVEPTINRQVMQSPAAHMPRAAIAAALVAEEIRALLLRNEPALSLGGQFVVDLETAATVAYKLTPEADCTTCYPSAASTPDLSIAEAALHYEYAMAFPPRHLANLKAHQHHFKPANVALQYERLRYPNNPQTPLPNIVLADLEAYKSARCRPAWPSALATMLRFTVGLRTAPDQLNNGHGQVARWAPTGGNLGSPHAYLLLLDCPGIPDGIYYYDAFDHALVAMHPHLEHLKATLTERVGSAEISGPGPWIYLVFAAELSRISRKYGPFSYRLSNLDTGCALAQLTMVADQIGIAPRILDPAAWQRHQESLLGVSGPPLITAIVQLKSDGSNPCL